MQGQLAQGNHKLIQNCAAGPGEFTCSRMISLACPWEDCFACYEQQYCQSSLTHLAIAQLRCDEAKYIVQGHHSGRPAARLRGRCKAKVVAHHEGTIVDAACHVAGLFLQHACHSSTCWAPTWSATIMTAHMSFSRHADDGIMITTQSAA